jgi:hypothetical protein
MSEMKKCRCSRLATHYITRLTLDGYSYGEKQLACDSFPNCRPILGSDGDVVAAKRIIGGTHFCGHGMMAMICPACTRQPRSSAVNERI